MSFPRCIPPGAIYGDERRTNLRVLPEFQTVHTFGLCRHTTHPFRLRLTAGPSKFPSSEFQCYHSSHHLSSSAGTLFRHQTHIFEISNIQLTAWQRPNVHRIVLVGTQSNSPCKISFQPNLQLHHNSRIS